MTIEEGFKYYDANPDFKEYVDKYCCKKHKTIEEVLQYKIVNDYLDYLLNKI